MTKRMLAVLLAASMTLGGCSALGNQEVPIEDGAVEASKSNDELSQASTDQTTDRATDATSEDVSDQADNITMDTTAHGVYAVGTSFLGDSEEIYYDKNLVPSVEPMTIADDFSNVYVAERFDYLLDPSNESQYNHVKDRMNALKNNGFYVSTSGDEEFFDIYEYNRYCMFPNFVTVDSLLHTYHLYFAHLLEKTEENYLTSKLTSLTDAMTAEAESAYSELKGTEWESAAFRNLIFFYTAELIQNDGNATSLMDKEALDTAKGEYDKIMAAGNIEKCPLTDEYEDYTQYKPRGNYTKSPELEKYFRTMMWYGRIGFVLKDEDQVRSSILISAAISGNESSWSEIFDITSFFAGASDDPGYAQMKEILVKAYGKIPEISDMKDNSSAFDTVLAERLNLGVPQINSVPVDEGDNPVIPTFRFMGQRFTIDAAIFQRLMYKEVEENANGERRSLPDTLDVPAALGSQKAYEILKEEGSTDYPNYDEQLAKAKAMFNNDDPVLWNSSLYAGWLNILRPLLEEKKEGYPSYMQSDEWTRKNLETFAGSYAELKHDTILYAKQAYAAEMGDGWEDEPDDRGYVDPQPVVYSRFVFLSEKTKEGLSARGMLAAEDAENLDKLTEIGKTLLTISEKELTNKERTDGEYEFIREYGGYLEHIWYDVNKDSIDDLFESNQAPCPVVADIATDPKGTVLEIGSGKADNIYVAFPMDGKLHIGSGSVYSFYQFETPISDRLTDEEFRERLDGGHMDDNWNWVKSEPAPDRAKWTLSYRVD
ncbi:DUF3160 domain-containing protein [Butyrivibrio sp. DSM 10294]|uniref:DUF3160 domain-containing protein n=1 Tax=Butyrivibrio sp. DSM 10294 TaxID=2972457 RepID=UPI00234F8F49|nr:DUF3160 domain-containing protein [Butyrivibrio sp. DSM 10294]MDC7294074.1 DUF3160 domain-containing protein [Butyrivibrio sp. DSM 10294]